MIALPKFNSLAPSVSRDTPRPVDRIIEDPELQDRWAEEYDRHIQAQQSFRRPANTEPR